MPLETDFNSTPFYDDYDEDKKFHRVLFRPSTPVQARELTQLQTILQNQIERFGDNIFFEGTIIKGCAFNLDNKYFYIKILDNRVDGQLVNVEQFIGTIVRDEASNLESIVIDGITGLQSQNPDLNTLYIKYLNTGTSSTKVYNQNSTLETYVENFTQELDEVANVIFDDSNPSFSNKPTIALDPSLQWSDNISNNDIVYIAGSNDNNGVYKIDARESNTVISLQTAGIDETNTSATVSLKIRKHIAGIRVAPSANYTDPVGTGFGFKVSDGIIYQKGNFIKVDPQTIVVGKYTPTPNGYSVGFTTDELIVNSSIDESLLDNAQGAPNENAPGAWRLKLSPRLISKTYAEASSANNFFSLADIERGRIVKSKQLTEYSAIGQEMARRTKEESGDYVVRPFSITTKEITGNTTHVELIVGSGLGYVSGKRIEFLNSVSIPVRKGIDAKEVPGQTISQTYGNYVVVDELVGTFPSNKGVTVSLRDTAGDSITNNTFTNTPAAPGNEIGTAKVMGFVNDSGLPGTPTARYRLHLSQVAMLAGKKFEDVRAVHYDGTNKGLADVTLESNTAILRESNFDSLIYKFGKKALKTLRNESNGNETQYIRRTVNESVSFDTAGEMTVTLTGDDYFPYSVDTTLSETQKSDFIFIARATQDTDDKTGTVTTSASSNVVTGNSTTFTTEYDIGDYITIATANSSNDTRLITNIISDTSLQVATDYTQTISEETHARRFPAGSIIPFVNRTSSLDIDITGQQLTATLDETLAGSLSATIAHNIKRVSAVQLTKNIRKDRYVKIDLNTNVGGTTGPWALGLPDVVRIKAIYKDTTYNESAADVKSQFTLDTGARNTHYGLARLIKKPNSTLSLTSGDKLLVVLDAFEHTNTGGGIGFFSADSYPVDDATEILPSDKIRTEAISLFRAQRGGFFDLRNSVDFRPTVDSTASYATTAAGATVNPSATEDFPNADLNLPAPNQSFQTDLQYYLPRIDLITLNKSGNIQIVEGSPNKNPVAPKNPEGTMIIGTIQIAAYPSLAIDAATTKGRTDYGVTTKAVQNKRYTMVDIGQLEKRLRNLEYYTSLSLLEKKSEDLVITSDLTGGDRFKYGIFVDTFNDLSLTDKTNPEFKAAHDAVEGSVTPPFTQTIIDLDNPNDDPVVIPSTPLDLFNQPIASNYRNCAETFWRWNGYVKLWPDSDIYYETRDPPIVNDPLPPESEPPATSNTGPIITPLPDDGTLQEDIVIEGGSFNFTGPQNFDGPLDRNFKMQ